mmetsp:Transcript_12567/g.30682  ORF Transcript_12567/g.30682 Transcript_12567/m.30682 type:complete len:96 (-) Transcript_12567:310-597(-)
MMSDCFMSVKDGSENDVRLSYAGNRSRKFALAFFMPTQRSSPYYHNRAFPFAPQANQEARGGVAKGHIEFRPFRHQHQAAKRCHNLSWTRGRLHP